MLRLDGTESFGKRPIGSERSRFILGSVRDAGANFQAKDFVNSRSITRITTTTTIRPTEAIGNCYVSIATKMSIHDMKMQSGMARRLMVVSRNRLLPTGRSLVSTPC